jgi:AraC-like DNA-binding protein
VMLMLSTAGAGAQDTVLVRQHALQYPVRSVAVDGEGTVWISSAQGRERWDGKQFEVVNPNDFGGVAVLDGKVVEVDRFIEASRGIAPHVIYAAWRGHVPGDRADMSAGKDPLGLWWVCDGETLYNFKVVNRPVRELPGKSTRGLYFDGDRLVAATYDGLYVEGDRVCEDLLFADGNVFRRGDSLFVFGMNLAIVDRATGLCDVFLPSEPTLTYQVGHEWKEGLLIGGGQGLGIWRGDSVELLAAGVDVRGLVSGGDRLFVLTLNQGVFQWDGERLVATGIPGDIRCADMAQLNADTWVLATDHGLGFWDEQENRIEFVTVSDGLGSNAVCNVYVDTFKTVWCSTYNGVYRWIPATRAVESHFAGVEFNRGSFAVAPDGSLWFGSVDGIFSVMPQEPARALPSEASPKSMAWWVAGAGGVLILSSLLTASWIRTRRQKAVWEQERHLRDQQILLLQMERIVMAGLAGASVATVAQAMGMSERHLYRKAKDLGLKAGDVIRDVKLDYAQKRLKEGLATAEVAREVGYTRDYLKKLMTERASP